MLLYKKINELYKSSINSLVNCGVNPDDSHELKLQKQIMTLLPVIIGIAATMWGSIYLFLGHYLSASIPLSYSLISALSLVHFSYSKDIVFLKRSQLLLVLLLPFLLMWSLGGFAAGSYVMIWAFYAPLASLSFTKKDSIVWFLLFLLLTLISFLIDHSLIEHVEPLPEFGIRIFSLLNVTAGFGGIFYMMVHYIQERDEIADEHYKNELQLQQEKQKAELAAHEQNSLLSLFDKGDSILFKWRNDAVWSVEYVSQSVSRLLGYDIKDFTSNRVAYASCVHKDDLPQVMSEVTQAIENNSDFFKHEPYRVITEGGEIKWILDYTVTQKDDNGEITHFIGYITDITKQQSINLELQEAIAYADKANSSKSEFLANMSHEIRTPLNAIIGFIKLLKEKESDSIKKKYLNIISSSSNSLLNTINDILDFSKIESGHLSIEHIDFNPAAEFSVTPSLFKTKLEEKNITLHTHHENLPKALSGDVLRINQILNNLLSNAIKFTPENKNIYLSITYMDGHLNISVKDEGVGINKKYQTIIFKAFSQEDSSTTRRYGGTGLGLSISYNLVRMMEGELKVKSELGHGSEFYFSIPLETAELLPLSPNTNEEVSFNGKKILLVEDNKANQIFMSVILEMMDLEFDIASDGAEAVKIYTSVMLDSKFQKYDAILMDENMPNMSGIQATRHIIEFEKESKIAHTPIIALTANAMVGDRERFLGVGMDEYITKPVDKKKLNDILALFLNK